MFIGQFELTREQMPSYEDFQSNPKHLYNLIQDQLNNGLQVAALQQGQMMNNANNNQQGMNNGK